MCGRYTVAATGAELAARFDLAELPLFQALYNVAPSQQVPAITNEAPSQLSRLQWGLVPSWTREVSGNAPINARAETLPEKPFFRDAFRQRRCLIPATGFYEWKKTGPRKMPMYVHLPDDPLFAFAGLWEEREGMDGAVLRTCAIVTVEPNALMRTIHHRMPAILSREAERAWLAPGSSLPGLAELLKPYPSEALEAYPVSTRVNSPTHDDPDCLQREGGEIGLLFP